MILRFPKPPNQKLPANFLNFKDWDDFLKAWDEALFGASTQQVHKLPMLLIAGFIIAAVCTVELAHVSFVQRLENMTYDYRVRLTHRQSAGHPNLATNLGLVQITDDTIKMVNRGTLGYKYALYWPRTVYAEGLAELARQGAAAVGFDVVFDSRRPDDPKPKAADGTSLGADEYFADVIKQSGVAILGAEHSLMPERLFQQGAVDVGNVGADPDEDGVQRHDRPYVVYRIWDPFIVQLALAVEFDLDQTTVDFGTCAFEPDDITDLKTLADKLTAQTNAVAKYLRGRLDAPTTEALLNFKGTPGESNNLQTALIKALNAVVASPSIYEDGRFAGIELRPEVFRLLENNERDGGARRLNRVLLEDSFPLELARNEAATITFVCKRANTTNFISGDRFDAPELARALTNKASSLVTYLDDHLDTNARAALACYAASQTNEDQLEKALMDNFNRIISAGPLYDSKRFENIVLRLETERRLAQHPSGNDLVQLNRMLLEDAFRHPLTYTYTKDKDGFMATRSLVREVPADTPQFIPYAYRMVWSMGIVLAAQSELKLDLDKAEIQPEHHRVILHGDKGVTRVIPLEKDGSYYIDWELVVTDKSLQKAGPDGRPLLQVGDLDQLLLQHMYRAEGSPDTSTNNWWTNRLVMVGSAATALSDSGQTPLQASAILVSKHLNVANAILTNRFITTSPEWLTLGLIILLGSLAAWITAAVARSLVGTAIMVAVVAIYLTLAFWLYAEFRFWLPVFLPLFVSSLVTHAGALTYRVQAEQSAKKRVKSVFAKMLAAEVVEELLQRGKLEMGGVRREITVYFADVRGFTTLTDKTQIQAAEYIAKNKLSPAEAEAYYNQVAKETLHTVSTYLATIAGAIKKHNGTLDKYIGDCAMAFWGGPLDNPHHARDAVRSAIDAQRAMLALNLKRDAENKRIQAEAANRAAQGLPPEALHPLLSMGTGINTGTAIMGLMGSEEDGLNYTVFGREVNLASRLEGLSGYGRIIISHTTFLALERDAPDLAALCIEQIPENLKGFREAVKNYEVRWRPEGGPEDPTLTQSPLVYGTGTSTFMR